MLAVTVALALAGCAKTTTRHLGPAEFLDKTNAKANALYSIRFVGVRDGRAWLEEWTYRPVLGERTTKLWTEAEGLAPETLRDLEAKRVEYERRVAEERRRNLGG